MLSLASNHPGRVPAATPGRPREGNGFVKQLSTGSFATATAMTASGANGKRPDGRRASTGDPDLLWSFESAAAALDQELDDYRSFAEHLDSPGLGHRQRPGTVADDGWSGSSHASWSGSSHVSSDNDSALSDEPGDDDTALLLSRMESAGEENLLDSANWNDSADWGDAALVALRLAEARFARRMSDIAEDREKTADLGDEQPGSIADDEWSDSSHVSSDTDSALSDELGNVDLWADAGEPGPFDENYDETQAAEDASEENGTSGRLSTTPFVTATATPPARDPGLGREQTGNMVVDSSDGRRARRAKSGAVLQVAGESSSESAAAALDRRLDDLDECLTKRVARPNARPSLIELAERLFVSPPPSPVKNIHMSSAYVSLADVKAVTSAESLHSVVATDDASPSEAHGAVPSRMGTKHATPGVPFTNAWCALFSCRRQQEREDTTHWTRR